MATKGEQVGVNGGKNIHLITGICAIVFAVILLWLDPDLRKDGPALFATLTGTATLYGLVFAILEVKRTTSVAQKAADSAKIAERNLARIYGVRDATECQMCIENALKIMDENGLISAATLSRILRIYASEFSNEYADIESDVRQRMDLIKSYSSLHHKHKSKANNGLQNVLIDMNIHLSAHIKNHNNLENIE